MGFKKNGFTLAEVLITLGIIGVIASLTIPTLVKNYQDSQFKTAYKKAYSVAFQAVLSANQHDTFAYANGEGDYANQKANFIAFMNEFKVTKKCLNKDCSKCWDTSGEKLISAGYPDENSYAFIDSSGMAWVMYYNGLFIIFVDTNGFNKPNQSGKDRFIFFPSNETAISGTGIPNKVTVPADNTWGCPVTNKCAKEKNYYSTSWLYK